MTTPNPSGDENAVAVKAYLRRRQLIAAVLLALAALAYWTASRLNWCRVLAADGLAPPRDFDVKGSDWSPWLTPLALVLLAAILAAFSVRGWGLRIIALLVAAAGVLAAIPAISLVTGGADSDYASDAADIPGRFQIILITTNSWAAVVVLAGTVCAVLAGILLLRVAGGVSGMSSKYKTPGARREELERQIFADHDKRKSAAAEASTTGPAAGRPASQDATRASDWDHAADGTPDTTTGPSSAGNDAPPANERMLWDALDTGIDPTEVPDDDHGEERRRGDQR
ncbi:TIGR02234 family membrane protein [Gordonia sp. OPL2]|uniref:TIGR02234 family membrane protein n=1 Tax=Gordonia sp. OPL2 TaxID=2486274 RepID=UPI00165592A4|nr:TIGR02234 family membrane protein [Gordonia sp. OPL2]ROZ88831.1 TIGR02234 family membrane protein [Gordonia sp. OPL2]